MFAFPESVMHDMSRLLKNTYIFRMKARKVELTKLVF